MQKNFLENNHLCLSFRVYICIDKSVVTCCFTDDDDDDGGDNQLLVNVNDIDVWRLLWKYFPVSFAGLYIQKKSVKSGIIKEETNKEGLRF